MPTRDDRVGALIAQAIDGQARATATLLEAVVGLREDTRALRDELAPVVAFAKAQQEREEASVLEARVAAAVAAQVEAIKAKETSVVPAVPDNTGGGGLGAFLLDKRVLTLLAGVGVVVGGIIDALLGAGAPPPSAPAALPMDDAPTVLEALNENPPD